MTTFYLSARPQTVLSIVEDKRLPDPLPTWIEEKSLTLFSNHLECLADSKEKNPSQIFLLELHSEEDWFPGEKKREVDVLQEGWSIEKIHVQKESSRKLLSNIFKGRLSVPVSVDSEVFPRKKSESLIGICEGSLLDSSMQTHVNTVNCVGVMGKGVALAFKQRYPGMFTEYKQRCEQNKMEIGKPYLYKGIDHWILNFPTKRDWRNNSRIEDLEAGLAYLAAHAKAWRITSLAMSALGCVNGKLDWHDVEPLIRKYLEPLNIPIELYPHYGKKIGPLRPWGGSKSARGPRAYTPRGRGHFFKGGSVGNKRQPSAWGGSPSSGKVPKRG